MPYNGGLRAKCQALGAAAALPTRSRFIMGLHLHSFGFLVLIPAAFLDLPFMPEVVSNAGDFLSGFVLLWIVVYIFLALRRVYRQGRVRTGIKYFFLWILYSVFFVVGIILSGVLALAFTSS